MHCIVVVLTKVLSMFNYRTYLVYTRLVLASVDRIPTAPHEPYLGGNGRHAS